MINLEKSVGSRFLAQTIDSTALQKNARLTEWVRLRFFQSTVKPIAYTINPCPTDFSRINIYRSLFFLIISLPMLISCDQGKVEPQQRLRSVKYQQINAVNSESSHTFSGLAKNSLEANLSFKLAGTIEALPVKVGAHIKANQLIAKLDASQYELQVQQSQASLAQATAALRNASSVLERMKGLYENNNASRQELDAARAADDSNKAQVRAAKKSLQLARLNLSYTRLKSSKDCDVAEVNVENNENVNSGQSIVKVSCGQQLNVEVAIPGSVVGLIQPDMPSVVSFSARPDQTYTALVSEVGIASSGGGATFPVTVALKDKPQGLRSGMVADVTFRFNNHATKKSFVVPAFAVSEDINGRFVYLVKPSENKNVGIINRRNVTIGEISANGLEIQEGLELGDKVVTAGITVIRDKLKVRID